MMLKVYEITDFAIKSKNNSPQSPSRVLGIDGGHREELLRAVNSEL